MVGAIRIDRLGVVFNGEGCVALLEGCISSCFELKMKKGQTAVSIHSSNEFLPRHAMVIVSLVVNENSNYLPVFFFSRPTKRFSSRLALL